MREACGSVGELALACKNMPSSVMDELSMNKALTLFVGAVGADAPIVEKLGADTAQRIAADTRIATKFYYGNWIPNRLLTACTLHALSLNKPLVLATRLPRSTLTFRVNGTGLCNFTVQDVAPTGNTYLIGKGILHTMQGPVVVGAVVADIIALISVNATAHAWSTVAAAASGVVGRLRTTFTRPNAANVSCPTPELVARTLSAHPELTACITANAKGCAAGWGTPATVFCSSDSSYGETFCRMPPGERDAVPHDQAEELVAKQLYVPGQRLGLADLPKADLSSLRAVAGTTIAIACSDGNCSVRTSPSTPAAAVVAEVPLGDSIIILVASSSVWPRVT